MIVINKTNDSCAERVLLNNGFEIISSWYDGNIFEKNGVKYGINHPVWIGKNVNIYAK